MLAVVCRVVERDRKLGIEALNAGLTAVRPVSVIPSSPVNVMPSAPVKRDPVGSGEGDPIGARQTYSARIREVKGDA